MDLNAKIRPLIDLHLLKGPQLVLMILYNEQGLGWTKTELEKVTGISRSTMTMIKGSLKDDGLVEEHFPFRDGRTVKLVLTDDGRGRAAQLWETLEAFVGARPLLVPGEPATD